MDKKQTTMRFTPQDLEAITQIRECYGCISDIAAVRLALQIVARKEQDYEQLVQVAEIYVDAFGEDEMLTLLEAMRRASVRDAIARWRKKQET